MENTPINKMRYWEALHCGNITTKEIKQWVGDKDWQEVRLRMKGSSLYYKWTQLYLWLVRNEFNRGACVQVTNYINALKRAGMIK